MTAFGDRLRGNFPPEAETAAMAEAPRPPAGPVTKEQCQAAERRYAEDEAAAEALVRNVFRPLLEEFRAVMESGGVFSCTAGPGGVREGRAPLGPHFCSFQATGSAHQVRGEAPQRRDYLIRLSAAAYRSAPLQLSVECCHGATRACRFTPPRTHLVEFDPRQVSAEDIDHESAGQWCADLLEKCAEACREANSPTLCGTGDER